MDFMSFAILLIISAIASAVFHYGLHYYVTPGLGSFFSKIVIGWVGAWLGTLVLGQWWDGLNYGNVYYVPALIGCLAVLIFAVDFVRTWGSALRLHS